MFSIGLLSFIINISCTKHSSFPRHFLRTYNFRQGSWGRNAGQTSAWKASVKRANFSRQTVALPPLCFCTCNQDLFCTKTCIVPFMKPFHSFKLKCFTQTYRDLYGDAMLVVTCMSSNMADGNQQKHMVPSFATRA